MNISKNNIKIGIAISICLIFIAVIVLVLSKNNKNEQEVSSVDTLSVMQGVPSDAVIIFHFREANEFSNMISDTLSFGEKIVDKDNLLIEFFNKISLIPKVSELPLAYSLHYSAKNEVSFLQVITMDESNILQIKEFLESNLGYKKNYNSVKVYGRSTKVSAAIFDNILVMSNSMNVLESSIRHLVTGSSILDNLDFSSMSKKYGVNSAIYVNNKQIGKFFSGEVVYDFLGYSDFFLNFASWSAFKFSPTEGKLNLLGEFLDNKDPKNISSMFYKLNSVECNIGEILPSSTLFALWLPLPSSNEYLSALNSYMEVHRSQGRYAYKQNMVAIKGEPTPMQWADSLNIEGLAVAYCKFGEKHEWITLIKEKSKGWADKLINSVVSKDKEIESAPYKYKGYLASVYGDSFGWCSEDYYSKVDDWIILSSKDVIDEYNSGAAYFYNLSYFLDQTPAQDFLKREALSKVIVNINESPDTLLQIFKPYLKTQFKRSAEAHNFEYLTLDINKGVNIQANIEYYSQNLYAVPKPPEVEEGVLPIIIDSTIVLPKAPYEVYDVVKKEKAYLMQFPNNKLQYLDKNKKGVWTIPFNIPICGAVEQADLYNNGKLQMFFIAEDKLYALDRAARFVYGYPAKLSQKVVYGPKIVEIDGDVSFMTLNVDNSISQYTIDGTVVKGWRGVKAPEFIRELPKLEVIGGTRYWVLRTQLSTRLYRLDGTEVVINDKKRSISPESTIEFVGDNSIKVSGVDERFFILNLETGKTKKAR